MFRPLHLYTNVDIFQASKQIPDKALCEVTYKTTVCSPNVPKDTSFESLLTNTCESVLQTNLYPRTLISTTVQQLHDDGNLKSSVLNAVCLALLDSGLAMKCTFVAVTVILSPDNKLTVRPSAKEEKLSVASFTFVFYSTEPTKIAGCLSEGVFSMDFFKQASQMARETASELFTFFRKTVQAKLTRQFNVEGESLIEVSNS